MNKLLRLAVIVVVALTARAIPARAQLYGYTPYVGGWGWGCYGGGSTVQGDIANGLGHFAAGAGTYNLLTAQAGSINADTAIRLNQAANVTQSYLNRNYQMRYLARRDRIGRAREATEKRLQDSPDARDIASGDALNMALNDLNDRGVSVHILKGAKVRLSGSVVREIPFQYAPAGITLGVNALTRDGLPAALKGPACAAERPALEQFASDLRKQAGERKELRPETIDRGLGLIQSTWNKVEAVFPMGSAQRRDAEAYLKGLTGLLRLFQTPAAEVLLAGENGRPETKVGELLSLMSVNDLRFGVARTPRQKQVYEELYPLLAALRDESRPAEAPAQVQVRRRPVSVASQENRERPRTNVLRDLTAKGLKKRVVFNVREAPSE